MKKIAVFVIGLLFFASNCFAQFPMKRAKITDGTGTPSGYPSEITFGNGQVADDGDNTYTVSITGESTTISDTTTVNLSLTGTNITADGLYTAGDHLTLTGADLDVDDDFLLNTGDTGVGNYNFTGDFTVGIGTVGTLAIHPTGAFLVHSTTGEGLSLYSGGAGTDLELNSGGGGNVELFSGLTSGNPTFTLHGWDSGATASKSGGLVVSSDGTFSISNVTGENIAIMPGQNVGIGTILPQSLLQVNGTTYIRADKTGLASSQQNSQLSLQGATVTTKELALGYDTTNLYGYIQARDFGNTYDNLILQSQGANVGIGTTAPVRKLDVVGTVGIGTTIAGTDFIVDSTGNVGIGTTGPTAKLQVKGGSVYIPVAASYNLNLGGGAGGTRRLLLYDNADTIHQGFGVNLVSDSIYQSNWYGSAGPAGEGTLSLGFVSNANPGIYSEKVRITNAGNVGIGTTSPVSTLEIIESGVSPFKISNGASGNGDFLTINTNGNVGIGTNVPLEKLDIQYSTGKNIKTFNGSSDTDITGFILYNADGEACYCYPNATQDGLVVQSTIP